MPGDFGICVTPRLRSTKRCEPFHASRGRPVDALRFTSAEDENTARSRSSINEATSIEQTRCPSPMSRTEYTITSIRSAPALSKPQGFARLRLRAFRSEPSSEFQPDHLIPIALLEACRCPRTEHPLREDHRRLLPSSRIVARSAEQAHPCHDPPSNHVLATTIELVSAVSCHRRSRCRRRRSTYHCRRCRSRSVDHPIAADHPSSPEPPLE